MSSQLTPSKRRLSQELTSPASKIEYLVGEDVSTFVFLKCNVTNINNPRLTEMAMIAVSKKDLLGDGCGNGIMTDGNLRFKDTMVLSFDPLDPIDAQDSANTDLTSERLKDCNSKVFDADAVHMINNFLQKQKQPVCLLAHNGSNVDFKVLKRECNKLNMTFCSGIGTQLFFTDTIWLFCGADHPENDIGDGVRRILFSEPSASGDRNYNMNKKCVSPKASRQPTMLDLVRYSFENVYRRHIGRYPDANLRSAKYSAQCLLKIFQKIPENLHAIPCRNFTHYSNNDASPKISKNVLSTLLDQPRPSTLPIGVPSGGTVQTYVFLDLETTCLDIEVCGIAELCMIAVDKSQLDLIHNNGASWEFSRNILPRILDECSLMIRPLDDVSEQASRINGLTTEGFDSRAISCFTRRICGILEDFLSRQVKPICLVAHYGNRFDFPVLESHLKRARTDHRIWSEIYCADTYMGLKELVERNSYRLTTVYDDLAGSLEVIHPPAHTAEGDVLRMITIVRLLPENLLRWMDEKKRRFRQQ